MLPLLGPGQSVVDEYLAQLSENEEELPWPEGVAPILTWGCGMYACVDCTDPDGQVLLFEPNAYVAGGGAECWYLEAASLAAWLETWLAGTGWYQEDARERGEAVDPEPWEHAAARLSGGVEVAPTARPDGLRRAGGTPPPARHALTVAADG